MNHESLMTGEQQPAPGWQVLFGVGPIDPAFAAVLPCSIGMVTSTWPKLAPACSTHTLCRDQTVPLSCATCRFDSIGSLLRSQAGLHASASPMGQRRSVKGLYMYGGVGCGKTMLMDLLVSAAPREFQVRGCRPRW